MLALHEWGTGQGAQANQCLGLAVRGAQTLGLHQEDGSDDSWDLVEALVRGLAPVPYLGIDGQTSNSGGADREMLLDPDGAEAFIAEETRRRTFWSCFILDRYMASGARRPTMIRPDDVQLQLPCGEKTWAFGTRACTSGLQNLPHGMSYMLPAKRTLYRQLKDGAGVRMMDELRRVVKEAHGSGGYMDHAGDDAVVNEDEQNESPLSRMVRLVDMWEQVVRWSLSGGRR